MLGDVLLITEKHKRAAQQIIEKLGDIYSLRKYTIAIGGESGSGKSAISHMVSKILKEHGIYAKILHTDNYYRIIPVERAAWRRKHGVESIGDSELNWERIKQNINDFKSSNKTKMPCIDLLTDQVDTLETDFSNIPVLILDGLYCLKADVDLKIMIDITYHDTKGAQIERGKEKLDEERLKVLEQEHKVVQSFRSNADLIINKNYEVEKFS